MANLGVLPTNFINTEAKVALTTINLSGTTMDFVSVSDYKRDLPLQFQQSNGSLYSNVVLNGDMTGTISGIVQVDGLPISNVEVALFARAEKNLISRVKTTVDGSFVFNNLLVDAISNQGYFVIAFDMDGSPMKNAKIFDYMTSIAQT